MRVSVKLIEDISALIFLLFTNTDKHCIKIIWILKFQQSNALQNIVVLNFAGLSKRSSLLFCYLAFL